MKIPSAQLNHSEQPVALVYSRPENQRSTTLLGRIAFTAGLLSVVGMVLSVLLADDFRLQSMMRLAAVGAALVALVVGILARRDRKAQPGAGRIEARNGIILAGGTAVLMFLSSTLFAPFVCNYPTERVNRIKCGSNLRQIGQGLELYANDHGGQYPAQLGALITNADLSPEVFVCPSSNDQNATGNTAQQILIDLARPGHCSYVFLAAGMRKAAIPAGFVVAYEDIDHHEKDGANFLFGDGHVESRTDAANLIKQLKAGVNPPK
jgi:prepilin-type processing-associated H-X9-DG protein